jgi:hypothetical protein
MKLRLRAGAEPPTDFRSDLRGCAAARHGDAVDRNCTGAIDGGAVGRRRTRAFGFVPRRRRLRDVLPSVQTPLALTQRGHGAK